VNVPQQAQAGFAGATMTTPLALDLERLKARAFDRAEWAEGVLRHYHSLTPTLAPAVTRQLRPLYDWMFVPPTLWPCNVQDVLTDCLAVLDKKGRLKAHHRLLLDLLPAPPSEAICRAVADHELHVQQGSYEDLITSPAKYSQNELATTTDLELRRQWGRLKSAFNVRAYRDHKGVIRRTMSTERNLRPWFSVNMRRRQEIFQAAFDAFCLRWNLYGMQKDEPLPLKLAVNITPYGTLIHIPAYWSFDPKRDIRWAAIAKLHRARVPGRQGPALAEGLVQRMRDAEKLRFLDPEARRRGLKGAKKHEFLCAGLGWDPRTSPKRLSRLRVEFRNRNQKKPIRL
jgi:hypothetical protein